MHPVLAGWFAISPSVYHWAQQAHPDFNDLPSAYADKRSSEIARATMLLYACSFQALTKHAGKVIGVGGNRQV